MFRTAEMMVQIPHGIETAPNQPWYGTILSINGFASGLLAMMRLAAPRIPRTMSHTPNEKAMFPCLPLPIGLTSFAYF
jgi:hypothetical protein